MEFLHCENIWRAIIGSFGVNGLSNKRMKLKEKEIQQKNNLAQLLTLILFFFSNLVPSNKINPHQKKL